MGKKFQLSLIIAVLVAIVATLCFSSDDKRRKVTISDFIATTSDTHLILFGVVDNSFTEEMISGLKSGIPVEFSFFVKLIEVRQNQKDQRITDMEFHHTMTYDTLKESYNVELSEQNNKILPFSSIGDAKKTMNEVNGVKTIALNKLSPNSSYKLKVKAEIFEKSLPMSLNRMLPFLSWWDKETDWHTLEFNY